MGAGEAALVESMTVGELLELARERAGEHPKGSPDPPGGPEAVFRQLGENWMLRYDGKTTYVKTRVGLKYIARLLMNPGQGTPVTSFQGSAPPARGVGGDGLAGEVSQGSGSAELVTDATALKECSERLRDLEGEIEQAEAQGDEGLVRKLKEEREKLMQYVRTGTGLRGRLRRVADARERARKAVTNAISRAISAVSEHHETLGRHLRNAVRTGYRVVYDPEKPVDWDL